ncbi:MAG: hydantoinase/oxoprolinase family protein, partial [Pseudomonadales bacterium]
MDADGNILEPLTDEDLQELVEQIKRHKPQAVAINLLFSYIDDYFEKQLEAAIQPLAYVCRSSAVLPEIREYERGIVTWYNAYLGPLVASYFRQLHSALNPAPISIMQSSGGTIAIDQAAHKAANLLLSGPAGGLAAAEYLGKLIHSEKMLSFDMGGTSTDVALLDKGIRLTSEGRIGRYPIALPMVDMHTIG